MKTIQLTVPFAAIAIALGSFSAEAQERGDRRDRGNQNQGQARSQSDAQARQGGGRADRGGQRGERRNTESRAQNQDRQRGDASAQRRDGQVDRGNVDRSRRGESRDSREYGRNGGYEPRRDYDRARSDDRRPNRSSGYSYGGGYGSSYSNNYGNSYGYSRNYYAPRLLPRRSSYRHYYGSGGHLSLYFGIGSGYLYGSPYSGRVYGYRGRSSYGSYQSYGDVRLLVSPRDAEVYVDGYYAGIVDDFDGRFQRLTLEAGPHEIEISGPDAEPRVFDVYVDPSHTVDLRADLLR